MSEEKVEYIPEVSEREQRTVAMVKLPVSIADLAILGDACERIYGRDVECEASNEWLRVMRKKVT